MFPLSLQSTAQENLNFRCLPPYCWRLQAASRKCCSDWWSYNRQISSFLRHYYSPAWLFLLFSFPFLFWESLKGGKNQWTQHCFENSRAQIEKAARGKDNRMFSKSTDRHSFTQTRSHKDSLAWMYNSSSYAETTWIHLVTTSGNMVQKSFLTLRSKPKFFKRGWIHFCCLKKKFGQKSQGLSQTCIKVFNLNESVGSFKSILPHIQVGIS